MFASLSKDQLRHKVPSVFTESASIHTSEKYKLISTLEVICGLESEGFVPVKAVQTQSRNLENKPFTKHMLRFRHIDVRPTVGGLFPELVLVNSHDGLSSYKLSAGLYRLICSNGLVAGENYQVIRVRHQGDIVSNVIEGTFEVMKSASLLLESADDMGSIQLGAEEKQIFAEAVHQMRFEKDSSLASIAIKPEQFLSARRGVERGKNDLFTIFNVAQENALKGGLRGWAKDPNGNDKRVSTREIKSIDQSNALNKALWTLAEKMRELKKA
jgi:hypothetical protein